MSKKNDRKLEVICDKLLSFGYEKDRFGNFKRTYIINGETQVYRWKIQSTSIRQEVECVHVATEYSPASKSWVRIDGDYIKNIEYVYEDRLGIARIKKVS